MAIDPDYPVFFPAGLFMCQLYGYSDEKALGVIKEAEAFVEEVETGDSLSAGEVALRARQHSLDTVDVVAGERMHLPGDGRNIIGELRRRTSSGCWLVE